MDTAQAESDVDACRGTQRILVVEDERQPRATVSTLLRLCGDVATEATNGVDAISTFDSNANAFALVLREITMPTTGGMALMATVAQKGRSPSFAFMTGFAQLADLAKLTNLALPVLFLPFAAVNRYCVVRKVLDMKDSR